MGSARYPGTDTSILESVDANWSAATMRVYAVDGVNGNDGNVGYADPTATGTGPYAIACALAGTRAKKTLAGLAAIFPRIGDGRDVEIVIANGGVNTEKAYAEALQTILGGAAGYNSLTVRGTGTNTTAGAVAFDGSAADADYQGAITASGCNTAGYNPTGSPTTSLVQCLKVGGGAAAIPVEPAAPLGLRMRFDAATTTAALRNICRQVAQVSGTDSLIPQTVWPAVPVSGDVFYLEQPGATFSASALTNSNMALPSTTVQQIVGIGFTGTITIRGGSWRLAFCQTTGNLTASTGSYQSVTTAQTFTHPVHGSRTVGGGLRTAAVTFGSGFGVFAGLVASTGSLAVTAPLSFTQFGAGCYGLSSSFLAAVLATMPGSALAPALGGTTALAAPRLVGSNRLRLIASQMTLGILDITSAGANAAVSVEGKCVVSLGGVVSGSSGNSDVGLDLTLSRGSLIILTTTPTVTGSNGDVRLAGGQIVTWAQAIATGVVDSAGNRIIGTAGTPPLGTINFSGSILGGAGATVSYMGDGGVIGAVNQTVAFRRATSMRLMTRLRVTSISNTATNAVTCTLYQNGSATAMVVSIPAATAANTKFVDAAHPILFVDGDDFDLRLDDAADVGAVVQVSAALEWAS